MIRSKYIHPLFFLAVLIVSGCKTTSLVQENAINPVPASYSGQIDTTNSATINWADFFTDSTLVSLIDTALQNNLDLLITLQRIEAARAELRYSKGLLLPVVDAVGSAGQIRLGEYSADWAGNEGSQYLNGQTMTPEIPDYYLGFQSAWELDVWGKLRNKKKAAFSRYLASIEGTNWVITNLVAEIANTYYELLALDNELEIIRETIKLQEEALSVVEAQKEAGVANALAVQQFEAQLLSLQSLEKEALQQIMETENLLNFLLGRFPQPIERNSSLLNDSLTVQVYTGIPSELLQNRPDIREAEYEVAATKFDVKSAKAAFFPSLSISAGIGYNAFNPTYLFFSPQSIAYNLFGNLTAPLFNLSAIRAEFEKANASQTEALYNYQKIIIAAFVEVSNELSGINNLDDIYTLKTQEVNTLTQSIETSSDLFKTGRATYLEVLLTQQNALQAKLELTNTKKRQNQAVINIYKALGGGWR